MELKKGESLRKQYSGPYGSCIREESLGATSQYVLSETLH